MYFHSNFYSRGFWLSKGKLFGEQVAKLFPEQFAPFSPPTAPTSLASSAITANGCTLTWVASTDNKAVTGYIIYRNGVQVSTTAAGVVTKAITGLVASSTQTFTVKATDADGNLSEASNSVNVTTAE